MSESQDWPWPDEPRYTEAEWFRRRALLRCAEEMHRPTVVQGEIGSPIRGFCECGEYEWTATRRA